MRIVQVVPDSQNRLSQKSWREGVKPEPRTLVFFLFKTVGQILIKAVNKEKA